MAIATCKECGAPLGRSGKCDHGRTGQAGGLPTSAKPVSPAAPAGGALSVVPPSGAPAVSVEPGAARDAAKAEVAAGLRKAGYTAAEAEELAENAIAKAQAAAQGAKA